MKKLNLKASILSFLIVFGITAMAQVNTDVKQKIEKMNKEMAQAMISGNNEKNLAYYTEDAVSLPAYEKMVKGKEAIKNSMDQMQKSGWKVQDMNFQTVSVETNGNIVTEIGTYKMSMKKDGAEMAQSDEGKYITLWEKQPDGSLKIKTEMWNSDKNPWAEMAEMQSKNKGMMGESKMKDENLDENKIDKTKSQDQMHNEWNKSDTTKNHMKMMDNDDNK